MAAPFQLLSGRGYQPAGYNPAPRFAVPYDVGTVNRVDRPTAPGYDYPGVPQDEPPAPMIDPQGGSVQDVNPSRGHFIEGPPDIGMGIPVDLNPGGPVASVNLDTASPVDAAVRALSSLGGRGGGGFKMPAPTPSAPRRQVGSRPEFIYTNPVAAKQAADNYAARLAAETGQERGYQDYAANVARSQQQGEQAAQQTQFAGQEGAANRASAERIAGTSESVRQQRIADAAWQENERAADMGEQTAGMLNANPNAKVDRKFAYLNPATGKWESRFRRQPRPAQTPGMGTPVPPPGVAAPALGVPPPPPVAAAPSPAVPAEAAPQPAEGPGLMRRVFDMSPAGVAYRFLTQ